MESRFFLRYSTGTSPEPLRVPEMFRTPRRLLDMEYVSRNNYTPLKGCVIVSGANSLSRGLGSSTIDFNPCQQNLKSKPLESEQLRRRLEAKRRNRRQTKNLKSIWYPD